MDNYHYLREACWVEVQTSWPVRSIQRYGPTQHAAMDACPGLTISELIEELLVIHDLLENS